MCLSKVSVDAPNFSQLCEKASARVKTIISQAMPNKKAIASFEQIFEDKMCELEAVLRATNAERSKPSGGHELACIVSDSNSKSTKRNRAGYEMRTSQSSKVCSIASHDSCL